MDEIHYMVAQAKRADMIQAIEKAHLIEEMRAAPAVKAPRRMPMLAMAGSGAALIVFVIARLHG
jgi:hypothetical protein